MRKNVFWLLTIFIFALVMTGCSEKETIADMPDQVNAVNGSSDIGETEKHALLVKEREALETQRKVEQGDFYVPLPQIGQEAEKKKVKAKALYLTANVAGFDFNEADIEYYSEYIKAVSGGTGKAPDTSRMNEINKLEKALAICKSTEINALVIDVKNDSGLVTWNSDIGIVKNLNSNWNTPLKNYETLIKYLKKNEIYCIARIVAFKDPYFASQMGEHAIQLKAGGVYKDRADTAWVNPFDEYVWKYLTAISKEAALRGFDEIQYDYVRFPDSAKYYNPITEFPGRNGRDKDEGIEEFLKYANKELEPYNINLSADVFGVATRTWDDKPEDIGQTWRKIANQTDYICPMIYPSHYGAGIYGYAVPDQFPYGVARASLIEALERNAAQKNPAIIRPWFQGFTAPWIKGYIEYSATAISDQMVASMELGIDEYIIWNASNNYEPMSFFYHTRINKNIRKSNEDILARTPEQALIRYLDAEKKGKLSNVYLLTPISERQEEYDEFAKERIDSQVILNNYEIINIVQNEDKTYTATINANYISIEGSADIKEAKYTIILENQVYKVIKPEVEWKKML